MGRRPLGQKNQMGSFNQRRELQALGWKERVGKGRYAACVEGHGPDGTGAGCVLAGPLAECHMDTWFVIVGAALTVVRNSPFCDGGLLNHLNEALEQAALGSGMDRSAAWTLVPPCSSCPMVGTTSILSEVAAQCDITPCNGKGNRKCLVFGRASCWGDCEEQAGGLALEFRSEPSLPPTARTTLHDGEPQYQRPAGLRPALPAPHGTRRRPPPSPLHLYPRNRCNRPLPPPVLPLHHLKVSFSSRCCGAVMCGVLSSCRSTNSPPR